MSKSRSSSKSHDSFNRNAIKKCIDDLLPTDYSVNNHDYHQLYNRLKLWLPTTNISNQNEKDLQLNFYQNYMKMFDKKIDDRLKYSDGFKGVIYKSLFKRLMPDFFLIDNYNSHVKSLSSGLDLDFLPIHIISVLEVKIKLKDTDIGQLIHYLQIVLDYSPSSRLFILDAITDFRDIRFLTVSRSNDDNEFKYVASIKALADENEHLLHNLTTYFTADLSIFGYHRINPLPNDLRINNRLLGIGANSMVFNCYLTNDQSNEYTLKISNQPVEKEVSIYEQLYSNKYEIVQIHPYAFLFLHPPGQIISKENLFNHIRTIWNQIKKAHQFGILHRDIRRANIIEIFNQKTGSWEILLIDWQSSIKIGSNVKYSGTLSTASNFILEELKNYPNSLIECLPIGDAISLMKMILLQILPESFQKSISSEVRQSSFSGILVVYDEIKKIWTNKSAVLIRCVTVQAHKL